MYQYRKTVFKIITFSVLVELYDVRGKLWECPPHIYRKWNIIASVLMLVLFVWSDCISWQKTQYLHVVWSVRWHVQDSVAVVCGSQKCELTKNNSVFLVRLTHVYLILNALFVYHMFRTQSVNILFISATRMTYKWMYLFYKSSSS